MPPLVTLEQLVRSIFSIFGQPLVNHDMPASDIDVQPRKLSDIMSGHP